MHGTQLSYLRPKALPVPLGDSDREAKRDLRLDFFRGISLFFIYIDHIQDNVLSYFTLQSVAFADAAEVFVFISGYTAAVVYGRAMRRQGKVFAVAQIYRRVWQLYLAHVVTFVMFAAEVSLAILTSHSYGEDFGISGFLQHPGVAIVQALALRYQPDLLNILPLYVVLLAMFPLVLWLLRSHSLLPIILSGTVYLWIWLFHWPPPDVGGDGWYFNPLAWQFLFIAGATAGHISSTPRSLSFRIPWIWKLAVAFAVLIAILKICWTIHDVYDEFPAPLLESLKSLVEDKTNLAPLRLLSFFALLVSVLHFVPRNHEWLQHRGIQWIVLVGRHSLQVFCLSVLLSVVATYLLAWRHEEVLVQLAVNFGGIALMVATAALLMRYKATSLRWSAAGGGPSSSYAVLVSRAVGRKIWSGDGVATLAGAIATIFRQKGRGRTVAR
jgi:hypothetical protein